MENKKNIIMIVVDAFRPKNLSLFGCEKETDKNIKKIAKENLFFSQFFSSSNSTAPSLTSIFTGKFPNNHGIIHQFPYTTQEELEKLEKNKFWLPNFLKEQGYETIAVDWIGSFFKEGFDYYEEKKEQESNFRKFLSTPFMKKILLNLPSWAYKMGKKTIKTRTSVKFSPAKDTMNLGIEKIKQTKQPFFLFMHFWDTHFPFPTTKFKSSKKNDIDEVLKKIKDRSQREYFKKRIIDIDLHSIEDMKDKYDASIKEVDKQIGRLHDFLKKNNLMNDTILIILGDHGTNLTDHGIYFSSSSLFEETIHVPFIMHLPGFEKKEITKFAQNVDIVPTLLEYLELNAPEEFDGKSMISLIKNGEKIRDKVFFFDGLCEDIRGVRTERKKLIIAKDPKCNLCKSKHHAEIEEYDLEKDPEEKTNIFSGKSELMVYLEDKGGIKEEKFITSESYI